MLIKLMSIILFLLSIGSLFNYFFYGRLLDPRYLLLFAILTTLNLYVYSSLGTAFLGGFNRALPFMQEFIP